VGIAIAFVYLAFLKHRVQKIDSEIAVLQPRLATTQAQQKRWQDMAPAIDPNLYVAETLLQASNSRSNQEVHFTVFDVSPDQFHIVGEAPNPEMALEFEERARKALSQFHLKDPAPPNFVDEKHTRFEIFGKR
jgi:sarcosine oxidase gamma subunit